MRLPRPLVAPLLIICAAASAQDGGRLLERFDDDGDGVLSPDELPRPALFERLDADGDGRVTAAELAGLRDALGDGLNGAGSRGRRDEAAEAALLGSDVVAVRDVRYASTPGVEARFQSLDLYRPAAPGPHPVVVFLHGGGWRMGDKAIGAVGAERGAFLAREGFVYASLNYRLSPKAVHPAHIEDVAAGVAWIASHVAEHGGDPARVVVMGHSAGAHLAALVACDARWLAAHGLGLDALAGAVLLDGAGYDLHRPRQGPGADHMRRMYEQAFGQDPAGWADASPIAHVSPGAPPYLIFHVATRQDSKVTSRLLADALVAAGGQAKVFSAEGKNHGTINREIGKAGDAVTAELLAFLRTGLRPRR